MTMPPRRPPALFLAALLALPLVAGCAAHVVSDDVRLSRPDDYARDYRLAVGDRVRLAVAGEATLSGEYDVDEKGAVTLPLAGAVPAAGLTAPLFAARVREVLARDYLPGATVTAEVARWRAVVIDGEVAKPSAYPFAQGLTVVQALAAAGGFTDKAERTVVFIRPSGEERERPFRLTDTLRAWPGDTIRVPGRIL